MFKLNSSIEKLSHKLDSKLSGPTAQISSYSKKQGKGQIRRETKNKKSQETYDKESKEELEEIQPGSEDEDEQTETINEPVQQHASNKETEKKTLEISNNEGLYEIESINPNLSKTVAAPEANGKKFCEPASIVGEITSEGAEDCNLKEASALVELGMDKQLVKIEDGSNSRGHIQQEVLDSQNGLINKNDFQTVKLTNTMLEMEKDSAGQEAKTFYSSGKNNI